MKIPHGLYKRIIDFLVFSQCFQTKANRKAILLQAGLDDELKSQIEVEGDERTFVTLTTNVLINYGTLRDNRDALEEVLKAVRRSVGVDGQKKIDDIITELRKVRADSKEISSTPYKHSLLPLLDHNDRDERKKAIKGLEKYDDPDVVTKLLNRLKVEVDNSVQESLIANLCDRLRSKQNVEIEKGLSRFVDKKLPDDVKICFLQNIKKVQSNASKLYYEVTKQFAKDENERVRVQAVIMTNATIDKLIPFLVSKDCRVLEDSIKAITKRVNESTYKSLRDKLGEGNEAIQRGKVIALSRSEDEKVRKIISNDISKQEIKKEIRERLVEILCYKPKEKDISAMLGVVDEVGPEIQKGILRTANRKIPERLSKKLKSKILGLKNSHVWMIAAKKILEIDADKFNKKYWKRVFESEHMHFVTKRKVIEILHYEENQVIEKFLEEISKADSEVKRILQEIKSFESWSIGTGSVK